MRHAPSQPQATWLDSLGMPARIFWLCLLGMLFIVLGNSHTMLKGSVRVGSGLEAQISEHRTLKSSAAATHLLARTPVLGQ